MTTIRCARTYDAAALADLCGELGYPSTRQQIVARLAAIEALPSHKLLVAEDAEGRVVAWLLAAEAASLTGDAETEILGLVVTAESRNNGIGAELLRAAETWAQSRGAQRLRVRSNTAREPAHRFYERAGYTRSKSQHVFIKALDW